MKINYNVPKSLESLFTGKTQEDIDIIITTSLVTNDVSMVRNMCFDILSKVSHLQNVSADSVQSIKPAEISKVSTTVSSPPKPKSKPKKKVGGKDLSKIKNKFLKSLIK